MAPFLHTAENRGYRRAAERLGAKLLARPCPGSPNVKGCFAFLGEVFTHRA